jgi:hypothetical protein
MLSEKAVQKFKKLYKQRFNEKLTDEEAYQRANNLLNLYRVVYTPRIQREKNNENDYDNSKTNH